MAQSAKNGSSRLMPASKTLEKALVQSARQAQRLADAFGIKVPTSPVKVKAAPHK